MMRTTRTKRALWKYDNIMRSLCLLDFIDSPGLRSNVQRALSRGENYHATIRSDLRRLKEQEGDARQIAFLEHVSPVAWQHINFHGRFEFRISPEQVDIKAMVQELARFPIQSILIP